MTVSYQRHRPRASDEGYLNLKHCTRALAVALAYRDRYTQLHSDRVVAIAEAIGIRLGLDDEAIAVLKIGAAFHDIGKIGVPDRVLLKPGKLDEEETAVMRKHPELGAEIIMAIDLESAAEAAEAVRHHHEHFDGGGYPDQVVGDAIPLSSRIIGIADSYDAMAITRSYHQPRTHTRIMEILSEETGKKHDPHLMSVFREVIEDSAHKARQ